MTAVGVAIVHYRAEALLEQCLEQLRTNALQDIAVCVVDCGSESGLGWIEQTDSRFSVLHPGRNTGFAAATNLALEHLPNDSSYMLILNPDCLIEKDTLEVLTGYLEKNSDVGAATCRVLLPGGEIDPACRRSEPTLFSALSKQSGFQRLFPRSNVFGRYNLTYLNSGAPHDIDSGTCAFLLIRRQALEAIGGRLDERFFLYGEDLDLCRRIREAGYRIVYRPEVGATHVKGSGRIRDLRTTFHFYHAMWTYYRKWGSRRRNPFALGFLAIAISMFFAIEAVKNQVRKGWRKLRYNGA